MNEKARNGQEEMRVMANSPPRSTASLSRGPPRATGRGRPPNPSFFLHRLRAIAFSPFQDPQTEARGWLGAPHFALEPPRLPAGAENSFVLRWVAASSSRDLMISSLPPSGDCFLVPGPRSGGSGDRSAGSLPFSLPPWKQPSRSGRDSGTSE